MTFKKVLLGTTAVFGVGALFVSSAQAGELEVGLSGFMRTLAAFGDLEEESGTAGSREFYFRNDSEVNVKASATDDETGLSYGVTIELETDTSSTSNTDETWIYISGGFGEVRFGDEDGAVDNMKVGGFSVAAGTGGIDGAGEVASTGINIANSSDNTKIRYDSPVVGGLQIGISYTPDAGHGGSTENPLDNNGDLEDWIEAGAVFSGSFGGVDLKASVVGGWADGENQGDFSGVGAGATVGFSGFTVGGNWYTQDNDNNGVDGDLDGITLGVGAALGPANVSVTYGYQDIDATGNEPENIVVSGDVGILPGVAVQGDVSFFDRDAGADDDGVSGVVRLAVSF